jgi:hypothetical protein
MLRPLGRSNIARAGLNTKTVSDVLPPASSQSFLKVWCLYVLSVLFVPERILMYCPVFTYLPSTTLVCTVPTPLQQ